MLSTLYLLFLSTLLANPASLRSLPDNSSKTSQADSPKESSRVVIVRFLVRLEHAEEEALAKSVKDFAALEPTLRRIVPKINNRLGKPSSELRRLRNWDIAIFLPSEELASYANADLLAPLPGQPQAWRPLWVIPYGGLGSLSTSSWPHIMMRQDSKILLPDLVVEPGFLRILTILHREFGSKLLASLSDRRQKLDLLSSSHIRAKLAKDKELSAVCSLTAAEAQGRKQAPSLLLAAGISASAKEGKLLARLLAYLCEPERRKKWILRKTGLPAEAAKSLNLLPDVSSEDMEIVHRLWMKVPEVVESAEAYPVLNSLLLLLFGGGFVMLLFSAVGGRGGN